MDKVINKILDIVELPDLDTNHLDIINSVCEDMGVEARQHRPYWYKLHKLGYSSIDVMTISLTILIDGKWHRGGTINDIYNQIKNHFK